METLGHRQHPVSGSWASWYLEITPHSDPVSQLDKSLTNLSCPHEWDSGPIHGSGTPGPRWSHSSPGAARLGTSGGRGGFCGWKVKESNWFVTGEGIQKSLPLWSLSVHSLESSFKTSFLYKKVVQNEDEQRIYCFLETSDSATLKFTTLCPKRDGRTPIEQKTNVAMPKSQPAMGLLLSFLNPAPQSQRIVLAIQQIHDVPRRGAWWRIKGTKTSQTSAY